MSEYLHFDIYVTFVIELFIHHAEGTKYHRNM